jgi:hypothetical protein
MREMGQIELEVELKAKCAREKLGGKYMALSYKHCSLVLDIVNLSFCVLNPGRNQ